MSMNPRMQLVFGVDDYQGAIDDALLCGIDLSIGEGYVTKDELTVEYMKDILCIYTTKHFKRAYDVLYYNPLRDVNNIVGLTVDKVEYNSTTLRALAVVDDRFKHSGKIDIPTLSKDDIAIEYYKEYTNDFEDIAFQEKWHYSTTIDRFGAWPIKAYVLRYVFEKCGFDMSQLDYKRYKAMLVWDWC